MPSSRMAAPGPWMFGITPVKLNLHPELAWLSLGLETLNDTCAKQSVDHTGANSQITFLN